MEGSWEPGELPLVCPRRTNSQGREGGCLLQPKTAQAAMEQVATAYRGTSLPAACRKIIQPWHLKAATVKMLILGNFLMKPLD